MFIKVPATRSKITPVKKPVPATRNKVSTHDGWLANKKLVATYFGQYCTIMSARGLEFYDRPTEGQPQRLICVYPGEKFIVESSDSDLQIYRF
jgi:hypothetical protein